MNRFFSSAICAALMGVCLPPAGAQVAQQSDPGITRKQADEILNELRQIRQLLERQSAQAKPAQPQEPPARRATLNLGGVPMLGAKDAPLTIVEFTDYQCPFCRQFHITTFVELKKNYIDTGKVRFFSRDMPLDFHSNALRAAQAARCANDQGKFWPMRDLMGSHPDKLELESLLGYAGEVKLDVAALKTCVESEKYKNAVQTDVLEAMKIGAEGTPAFVIGKSTPEGVDGTVMIGALPYPMFEQKLRDAK
jgi:protein-disulfide isomerase